MNKYERDILDNIEKHGWFCTCVFDPDGKEPGFAYSVGFTQTLGAPECIIFGLSQKMMHSMLWTIFRQIKAGKSLEDGSRWSGLLEGFDCISRRVDPTNVKREYLNSAMWYWTQSGKEGLVPAYQIIWPGSQDGLFPWEEGSADTVREYQPPLYLPSANWH
jgi:hypothetical protein